jgi:hypothetical protein
MTKSDWKTIKKKEKSDKYNYLLIQSFLFFREITSLS